MFKTKCGLLSFYSDSYLKMEETYNYITIKQLLIVHCMEYLHAFGLENVNTSIMPNMKILNTISPFI